MTQRFFKRLEDQIVRFPRASLDYEKLKTREQIEKRAILESQLARSKDTNFKMNIEMEHLKQQLEDQKQLRERQKQSQERTKEHLGKALKELASAYQE